MKVVLAVTLEFPRIEECPASPQDAARELAERVAFALASVADDRFDIGVAVTSAEEGEG